MPGYRWRTPPREWRRGKLLFELRGYKLRGKWTLVRTKQDWLFIKERDAYVSEESTESYPTDSVFSGLTVEQLRDGIDSSEHVEQRLAELNAPRSHVTPSGAKVMLAETARQAFSKTGWLFRTQVRRVSTDSGTGKR